MFGQGIIVPLFYEKSEICKVTAYLETNCLKFTNTYCLILQYFLHVLCFFLHVGMLCREEMGGRKGKRFPFCYPKKRYLTD